jgi:hypothetical protein
VSQFEGGDRFDLTATKAQKWMAAPGVHGVRACFVCDHLLDDNEADLYAAAPMGWLLECAHLAEAGYTWERVPGTDAALRVRGPGLTEAQRCTCGLFLALRRAEGRPQACYQARGRHVRLHLDGEGRISRG